LKYFTPELHAKTCSENNVIADAAHAEWEKALERYEKRQAKIRPQMPRNVRILSEKLRLHDALLLFLGRSEDRCHLTLQTEEHHARIVSLEYAVLVEPVIEVNTLPIELQTNGCCFLYDEVDLVSRAGQNSFTHSILFSNGLHLRLRFRDLAIRFLDPLIELPPAVPRLSAQSA
jgi:hypothetical protein